MNNDLISRAWLKKHKFTTQVCNGLEIEYVDVVCVATIDNAPTVEQSYQMPKDYLKNKLDYSRPQGEWIKHIRCIECSICKNKFFADDENENCQDYEPCTDFDFNFCPKCGADMRGGRE